MRTRTQGTESDALLRRAVLLLAVAAVVVAMVAASTMPAFAAAPRYACVNESTGGVLTDVPPYAKHTLQKEGFDCSKERRQI